MKFMVDFISSRHEELDLHGLPRGHVLSLLPISRFLACCTWPFLPFIISPFPPQIVRLYLFQILSVVKKLLGR